MSAPTAPLPLDADRGTPAPPDSGVRAVPAPRSAENDPRRAEELALVARAQAGDRGAVAALLRRHAGLIHLTCRPYFGNTHDAEDVLQAGRIGFMRGVRGFDPTRGTKLWTYARDWVRLEARDALITAFPIILPRYRHIEVSASERTGDPSALARKLRKLLRMAKTDAPLHAGDSPGEMLTLGDTIESTTPLADEVAESSIDGDRARELIDAALASLAPRDGAIMRRRLLDGETLEAIGASVGLTRERVRQIVESRKPKLRGYIAVHATADERDLLRGA